MSGQRDPADRAETTIAGKALKIVMISRIYSPEPSAASLRLAALAAALVEDGHHVEVLTTRPPAHLSAGGETGDTRVRVSRWPVLRDRSGYVRGYLQYLSFDAPLVLRLLFGRRADVYVCEPPPTSGFATMLALALRRRPFVYYAADIWSDASTATGAPAPVIRIVRWIESVVLGHAARALVVSTGVERRVQELAPGADTVLVGHGVDLDIFASTGSVSVESADIVYVGSASEWHGAEVAVQALAQVMAEDRTLTAAFVGQGSSWGTLIAMVQDLGLSDRISFRSTVAPEQAAAWVRDARLSLATLVPGKGYDFAVPTKLYASVAVGTPVAYAGPDPVRTMIAENGLGVAVDYEADAYAAAIRKALDEISPSTRPHLVAWAEQNIASRSVAATAAAAIAGVVRSTS